MTTTTKRKEQCWCKSIDWRTMKHPMSIKLKKIHDKKNHSKTKGDKRN